MNNICNIHKEELKEDKVVIYYGLIRYSENYQKAINDNFPNANYVYLGGCFVMEEQFKIVLYCSECRKELIKWNNENNCKYGLPPKDIEEFIAMDNKRRNKYKRK